MQKTWRQEKTPNVGANVFWLILSTKIENIWKQYLTKNLNHQHFVHFHILSSFKNLDLGSQNDVDNTPKHILQHNGIPCFMRFPHQHPPPRPRLSSSFASTAAFASRSRWITESWSLTAAACSGVVPQEPQPEAKPRVEQNPTERRGEKVWENFGRLKSRSFGNCGHSKILPELKEHCGFEMFSGCFYDIELVEKTVACGVLSKPCQPCLQSRCTWINSNILQLYQTNLPMIGTPHHLKIIARFCSLCSWHVI